MSARALILLGVLGAALACSSTTPAAPAEDAGTCPEDLPAACPSPPPSYASQVQAIFETRCFACHTDGGVEANAHDFSTYDAIFKQRTDILTQVYSCRMPLPDAGQPTPEERAALLGWLVCHAPDN